MRNLVLVGVLLGAQPRVLDGDFADPFVLPVQNGYLAFGTGTDHVHVQLARSNDLVTWTRIGDALPKLPAWASSEPGYTWAPSVLARNHTFVLYYTTRDRASGFQCISRAVASSPEGPYVDDSTKPLVCQTKLCGSIDPSPFVDDEKKPWLLYKSDENSASCSGHARIWSSPLSDDGLSVIGDATELITTDRPWESPLVEGPSMFHANGTWVLFYSASYWDSARYAIGWASCEGPRGPCTKRSMDAPWMATTTSMIGPGGQEIFSDANGQAWMVFHAWTGAPSYASGGARSLHIAKLSISPAP